MKFEELCSLHHFIIQAGKRLKDEDGNLPFDSVSERRYCQSWDAAMIVLNRILEGRYVVYKEGKYER